MKWNESGFRPPLCTYRLNWARRTSWGWWDDWDDTVLQTQDSKFEPWRSEAEHATSRSRRLPTILTFTRGWGRNNFVSFKPPRPGTEPRTLAWKAAVLTTTLGPPPLKVVKGFLQLQVLVSRIHRLLTRGPPSPISLETNSCSILSIYVTALIYHIYFNKPPYSNKRPLPWFENKIRDHGTLYPDIKKLLQLKPTAPAASGGILTN